MDGARTDAESGELSVCPVRAVSGAVVSLSDGLASSLADSETRGLLVGVDGPARPSQRLDRLDGGVGVGVGAGAAEGGFGRYVRSRTRRARRFVWAVRPATFAVMVRKAPDGGVLTFCQRLVFSRKQVTENCTGADFEAS